MTSERGCYVYIMLPGATTFVTAGRFELATLEDGAGVGTFYYGRRYLERKDKVALDPVELQLREEPYQTTRMGGFFGAIRDSMPDAWGQRMMDRKARGRELSMFDYLLMGSDDRAGALAFGEDVAPPTSPGAVNQWTALKALQEAADAVVEGTDPPAPVEESEVAGLILLGTTLGGARPKAVVEHDNDLWVAKFGRMDDRCNYPVIEHAMLELATKCGLDAAESKMTKVAGRDVLLVRRFDRKYKGSDYLRYRMVSALTILIDDDSATAREKWSYLLLADEIRKCSEDFRTDLRELFGRICFNALISDLDDHPRNHAFIAQGKGWRLSPAFDLVPDLGRSKDYRPLSLKCGEHGYFANRENILSASSRFGLGTNEAESIVDRIADAVRTHWRPALESAGASRADISIVQQAFLYDGFFYKDIVDLDVLR